MNTLFVTISIAHLASGLFSVIVYSEYTLSELIEHFSQEISSSSRFDMRLIAMPKDLSLSVELSQANAIFDFTSSVAYEFELKSFSRQHKVLYFSDAFDPKEKWVFYLHPSPLTEATAIKKLLEELGWEEYHVIASETKDSRAKHNYLSDRPISVLSTTAHQEVYDHYVGRSIKPSGNWKVVTITSPQATSKFITALQNMRIYKERCGLIANLKGTWGKLETGTIVISQEGLEFSKSEEEYHFNSILRALNTLDRLSNGHSITDMEYLRNELERNTENHAISNTFSILNFSTDLTIVGNVTDRVVISKTIVLPGNITVFDRTTPVIAISGNLGIFNQDGSISGGAYLMTQGLLPMVKIINQDPNLLPNFVLEIHGTDCGPQYFDYSYASNCMKKHFDNLGVFFIDSNYEDVVVGNNRIFKENKVAIPQLGILIDDWKLYDKKKYPHLFITTPNRNYMYAIVPYILNSFRWDQILVYFHDTEVKEVRESLTKNTEILGISILNERKLVTKSYPTRENFLLENQEALKEAVRLKSRIYVLMLELPYLLWFIEALYDLGLRKGETIFILQYHISSFVDQEHIYLHSKEKVLELADGSLTLFPNEYIGEYGTDLKKQIAEIISPMPIAFTCFHIDSLLLGVHTIDLMLKIGRNFEDPSDIDYFMRQIQFTGCSGTVSIDSGGNGRNELSYNIRNFYVEDGKWIEEDTGNYTIGITLPLEISREIVWPNGQREIPQDMIEEPKCGIYESDISDNQPSILISVFGSIGFVLIVLVIAFTVLHKMNTTERKKVETRREIMFEDGVEIAIPFIEASQHVAIGPGISIFNSLDLIIAIDSYLEFEGNDFWRLFFVVISITSLWVFCNFLVISLLDKKCFRAFKNLARYLGLTMIPLFSKIVFIPVLWVLSRIFECKQGTGDHATDAFLKYDCNMPCWSGAHLGISIVAIIVLCVYSSLSCISGIVYDNVMDHVSIKTNAFFSIVKTSLSILLIVLHFHLRDTHPLVFSIVYLAVYAIWTFFVIIKEGFNYDRLNLWQKIIGLGVCSHLFVSVVREISNFNELVVIFLDLFIVFCMIVLGCVAQYKYFKGCFYKRQGRNFNKLLKFAYTNKLNPKELTVHELDYRRNRDPEIRIE